MFGRSNKKPHAPINLVADFAGGGLLAAYAIMVAIFERQTTNRGQILDLSLAEGLLIVVDFTVVIKSVYFYRISLCLFMDVDVT